MANHVSALKRARQTERKTAVNRANKSRVRGAIRSLREALAKGDV
ncbi:MAG TPA: 30S ribosomal protein S20, partial [Pseudacidobacterium sp.]|nr:30S ribosomal protein S20 [Pseudacidobacterium sp.]